MKIEDAFTTLRIVLAPVVMALIFKGEAVAALFVYIIASATDMFDGYFARKNKRASLSGDVFDSAADFTLVYFAAFAIAMSRGIPWIAGLMVFSMGITGSLIWVISRNKKKLSVPHRTSAKIFAFFVHPTVMAYIVSWQHAYNLLILGLIAGVYTAADYAIYAVKQK
jgi:phosphatidylglycerophosphate synthase